MCKNLRKVKFQLGSYEFRPDATEKEKDEMEELCREREGFFHKWVEDVDNTSKEIPYVKTFALIEEAANGKLHTIEFYNMNFTDQQNEREN